MINLEKELATESPRSGVLARDQSRYAVAKPSTAIGREYSGLVLLSEKVVGGGTSIKYWM